jgi:hypothetical protein
MNRRRRIGRENVIRISPREGRRGGHEGSQPRRFSRSRHLWSVLLLLLLPLAAVCLAATQTPALSLVRVHVPEHGVSGAETCTEDIHGDTYVKLEEGLFYWHLYNKGGLFAIPETELHRIEYVHCAALLNRN